MRSTNASVFVSSLVLVSCSASCGKAPDFKVLPQADGFVQATQYSNKVDILWIMDSSNSMVAHKANVIAQFGSFIDVMENNGMDFHLAITTTNMGGSGEQGHFIGSPNVLSAQSPNLKEAFKANLEIIQNRTALERGIEASVTSLSSSLLASSNAGFLRSDAFLAIIYVGDEDDKSGGTAASWAAEIDAVKPAFPYSKSWMANFIGVIDSNPACSTNNQVTYPGYRYMDLVKLTGGVSSSICTNDLSNALTKIRQFIIGITTSYRLTTVPVESTIQVSMNGQFVPKDTVNGWTYDASTNSVWLHGSSISTGDASVGITYTTAKAK